MNKELFHSMREQMRPSGEAREALMEKLASTKKKTVPVGRYVAIAACAAVIVAAVPASRAIRNRYELWTVMTGNFHKDAVVDTEVTRPHSYVMADDPAACWPADAGAPEHNTVAGAAGDQDQDMTSGELTDNMLEAGFTQEDVDGYLASGWQMTWSKWWKFYHQSEESGERTLEALLDFSKKEMLAVNTGEAPVEIPGGAYIGDAPDQSEAIMAYQNLMVRFEADYGAGRYPEWYGGAYIDGHAGLIVNIAADYEPEDKELYFQIWKWAGSERVGFGSSGSGLSLNQLKKLQGNVERNMEALGLQYGCGIDEEAGQVELTLPAATNEALWSLARLDPTDTAIRVTVGQMAVTDGLAEEPMMVAPSVSHDIQPSGDDVDPRTPVTYIPGVGEVIDTAWEPPQGDGPWQTEPSEGGTGAPVDNVPGMIVDADGVIAYEPQG